MADEDHEQPEVTGTTEATNDVPSEAGLPVAEAARTAKPAAKRKVSAMKKGAAATPVKKAARRAPAKSTAKSATQVAKFPRHSVEKALRIPKTIYEQNAGKPCTVKEAAILTGAVGVSGNFNVEVSSSKKYGFLEGAEGGRILLKDRAKHAIAPQTESDRRNALQEAVLAAPDLADVYNHYRGENLPDDEFFRNALTDRFGIPAEKVAEFLEVFYESVRAAELIDESGERPRLIDVGRDESHKGSRPAGPKVAVPGGTTCFVMQPFGGYLGTYYEEIFKPAITQAGLTPVRADDDIFATGKIMDQVWRGIRQAKVLVAELTSKNPNVFYELGLAHALEKPVILVSSNQEDVPFDLRHIRAIFYNQTDPFWGPKLIDKIADNIKSALTNPEEAIFRVDEG